jgi:hypothetical protein
VNTTALFCGNKIFFFASDAAMKEMANASIPFIRRNTMVTNTLDDLLRSPDDIDINKVVVELARRVRVLEETENVKRFMSHFGRWLDRVELTCDAEDFATLCAEKFAPDGYMDAFWGQWGPGADDLTEKFLSFAKTSVNWAVHCYLHQEVDLNENCTEAHFHAQEIVPMKGKLAENQVDGKFMWLLLENDSDLVKIDDGNGNFLWRMKRYGLREMKLIQQDDTEWVDIDINPESWMFKHPEHPQLRTHGEIMSNVKPLHLNEGADINII